MFQRHARLIAAGFISLLFSSSAFSNDSGIEFSGFASFVGAKTISDKKEGDYSEDITNDIDVRNFNTLGLRLDVDLKDSLRLGAQMVAYGEYDYQPEFDWLYFTYAMNSSFSITAGKIRTPLDMYSEYIDVGYAYQWIETPDSIYANPFFKTLDGAKLTWLTNIGDWTSEAVLFGGNTTQKFNALNQDLEVEIDGAIGLAWTLEYEWLTLRALYTTLDVTLNEFDGIDQFIGGLNVIADNINGAGPATPIDITALANSIYFADDTNETISIGTRLDFDVVYLVAEYSTSELDPNLLSGGDDSYYVLLGTRLTDTWSLNFTYSVVEAQAEQDTIDLVNELTADYVTDANPVIAGSAQGMRQLVEGTLTAAQERTTQEYILGTRWDFHKSAAFKMEFLMKKNDGYSADAAGQLSSVITKPRAFRVGVDLIF